jgi:hypothetical protein
VVRLGDVVVLHGSVAAALAVPGGTAPEDATVQKANGRPRQAVACLDARERPRDGSVLRLGIDPADIHLFDAATGLAIR